jgi:glycosyltransferase involved in cell wall biosynthesis
MKKIKNFAKFILSRYRDRLPLSWQRKYFKYVTVKPTGEIRGRVLLSYALTSAGLPANHPMFAYHTGPWESNRIISIFNRHGFIVDCIHYTNRSFIPKEDYDIIFACTGELYRLAAYSETRKKPIKIWHSVVSAINYNNNAELTRINELEKRRPGTLYFPKRQEPYEMMQDKLMKLADYCVLIGNQHVQDTFPKWFQSKITRVTVTASPLSWVKDEPDFVPPEKEWLWFFGNGAVRKGLDITLEAFAKHPEWKLNIIGLADQEPDFMKIYRRELLATPNITFHGYLNPGSEKFDTILRRCFAFIAPTATESISTAVATILQAGLYPLLSHDTGVDLPAGAGLYLRDLTVAEIEEKVTAVYRKNPAELVAEIRQTQSLALKEFSREKWLGDMGSAITKILSENNLI